MLKSMPPGQGVQIIERSWWVDYKTLRGALGDGTRVPTFGDYAVAHPDPEVDVDPRIMSINGRLRYTSGDNWLVATGGLFKGRGGSGMGGPALIPAARDLQAHPDYLGTDHCACEAWIDEVVRGANGGGNPMTWRRFGTHHHLRLVTEQIASLP